MDDPVIPANPITYLNPKRIRTSSDDDLEALRRVRHLLRSSKRLASAQVHISETILQVVEREVGER